MAAAIVLLTRDLRVHDQPALAAACRAGRQVPLFVLDPALLGGLHASPNRAAFLIECLADLDSSLRRMGGGLVLRRGDPVAEAMRVANAVGAAEIHLSADAGTHAAHRRIRLAEACSRAGLKLALHRGVAVVPPAELTPSGGDHFRVFTPCWRRWRAALWRPPVPVPGRMRLPDGIAPGRRPGPGDAVPGPRSPRLPRGGETEGRHLLNRWLRRDLPAYGDAHDDLPGDRTSRLSPYLHFGCVSPLEVALRTAGRQGGESFLRQLCWRDFHLQVLAARPDLTRRDYRSRGRHWKDDPDLLQAWSEGRTGVPVVDAGMRQLRREGRIHNRARLLVASFLVRELGIDWRRGAAHFFEWLVDGDVANNAGNWQWVAGTGNDTRPNRSFNHLRQALRFDPAGDYVRRYVPELRGIPGAAVHRPWALPAAERERIGYPDPIGPGARSGRS
ncbi:MAG TPA: deoxyribodipyrimidine photo-lyase [Candidatus Dormibacteraeota bacterium]|jgi:deoxyribodipyrimidine photo-lyase|nr:deoxyribodipyrimidine photo-lyase [Candidatus Dormibacteraeota bacterium]